MNLFQWWAWIGVAYRIGEEISLPRQYFRMLESEILVHLHNIRPGISRREPISRSGYWQARHANIIINRTQEPVQRQEMPITMHGYVPATAWQEAHPTQQATAMPDVGSGCMRFFSDGTYDYREGGTESNFKSREPNEFRCGMGVLNFITDAAEAALPPLEGHHRMGWAGY